MGSARVVRTAAPVRQQVTALMREDIISGVFAPGDRLPEPALCNRYEVSRTVVREALRQLEAEALVTIVPNRGPEVRSLTYDEAESIYQVRAALESLAARLFAERAGATLRKQLAQRFGAIEASYARGDIPRMLAAKAAYYETLLQGAASPAIPTALLPLHYRSQLLRSLTLAVDGRSKASLFEIRRITEAAVRGDADEAATAASDHVQAASAVALPQLAQLGKTDAAEVR